MQPETNTGAQALIRKLTAFAPLDSASQAAISQWPQSSRRAHRGHDIVDGGSDRQNCRLMMTGIAARTMITAQGKQQIVALLYPGDLIDLGLYHGREDSSALTAITDVRLAALPLAAMRRTAIEHLAVAEALWADVLGEAAIGREWLLNIGQRSAAGRLAHLVCEAAIRLAAVGYGEPTSFQFPFTQTQLASALALTSVHVNRTLRLLTGEGLLSYSAQRVTIHDLKGLRRVGDFDPAYLQGLAEAGAAPRR